MNSFFTTAVRSETSYDVLWLRRNDEVAWYAAYTRANHEKQVARQLEERAVEHFLPLYSSVRRWKDRRIRLELPLFPGYVFVHFALGDRLRVLQIPSVVRLVGVNGQPTALPDAEMEILRSRLPECSGAEPCPFLKIGRRVRVKTGPLAGLAGILVRRRSGPRVVISIDLIARSIIADIDSADLEIMR